MSLKIVQILFILMSPYYKINISNRLKHFIVITVFKDLIKKNIYPINIVVKMYFKMFILLR